jgi:hypothetical protein
MIFNVLLSRTFGLGLLLKVVSNVNSVQMKNKTEIDWERIENFVGFGCRDAPVIFVGIEEGLTGDGETDLCEDLKIRSSYAEVMDIKEAHRGIAGTERFFDPHRVRSQPTWRRMCDLMLRRDGVLAPTRDERKQYQALRLGRSNGDTLLVELLPVSAQEKGDWLYEKFGRYSTRPKYEEAMLPKRKEMLRRVLGQSHRELVLCYGKEDWRHYQALFDKARWTERGRLQVATISGTRVILADHLSSKFFNSSDQMATLAKIAWELS